MRLALLLLVSIAAFSAAVLAQDEEIDHAIEQNRSGVSVRELQVQVTAQPPDTKDRRELAIFYHKRGVANSLFGNYGRAIQDLRLALEHNPPNMLGNNWGERRLILLDLGIAITRRGDWFGAIDHWNSQAQESRQSDLYRYHYSQLRLMEAYNVLGQWTASQKAREEAEATLPKLRTLATWSTSGLNHTDVNKMYIAGHLRAQGQYREAESKYRDSLEAAGKYLIAAQGRYTKGHPLIRMAERNIRGLKSNLASILSTQSRYGEAEAYARAGLNIGAEECMSMGGTFGGRRFLIAQTKI